MIMQDLTDKYFRIYSIRFYLYRKNSIQTITVLWLVTILTRVRRNNDNDSYTDSNNFYVRIYSLNLKRKKKR